MLTFLHLSDIHFSVFEGEEDHDLEALVRERMLDDITDMHHLVGDMDAILLVGDVASRGNADEYAIASRFLDDVCRIIGCAEDRVVCVPGNHDVDRSRHDATHAAIRHQLRDVPSAQVSDTLRALLSQQRGAEALLDPFTEYNRFALRYRCSIDADQLTWTPKQFALGDRDLLVYGVNSAWVCDASDSKDSDQTKVVLGSFQCGRVGRRPEAISVAMVHHPPSWLRDSEDSMPWLSKAQLVLTGHEHETGITPGDRTLTIASGAVNPERTSQGWVPAYNVLQLDLEGDTLEVTAHVRSWQGAAVPPRAEFGPDPQLPNPYRAPVCLRPVLRPETEVAIQPDTAVEGLQDAVVDTSEPIGSDEGAMIFRIMRAAPDLRQRVARELELIDVADQGGLELDRRILAEAVGQDKLRQMDERISND